MDAVNLFDHKGRFFEVLQETPRAQTAVMTIAPRQDAGPEETHDGDQIIYIIEGEALVRMKDQERRAPAGTLILIPTGTPHHVRNVGWVPLFFLTIYAPPAY
ncbi:MAG: cupin domain-containing protein [candidate division NC10 bacterium]|nr:cupin domain-containing protein [candidate division NC10 bacterium]